MIFPTRSVAFASLLVCLVFLLLAAPGGAVSSSKCLDHVKQSQQETGRRWLSSCRRPICGSLDTNNNLIAFMDRLTDSCRKIMSKYSDPTMSRKLMARIQEEEARSMASFPYAPSWFTERSTSFQRCSSSPEASSATNPVVVESYGDHIANFAMCTVPKAGCTLLRTLLFTLTRDDSLPTTFHSSTVHGAKYPTIWHYHPKSDFPDTYPTFVIGRNPYIRLVSGFLDKMVVTASQNHDWVVMQRVNQDLHRHKDEVFEATPESFREFVLLMTQATKRNQHFDTAVDVCGMSQFQYRYMLRIEDMAEWYPCWADGLKLNNFVWSGWERSDDGDILHKEGLQNCWWKPEGTTCDIYYEKTHNKKGRAAMPKSWKSNSINRGGDKHDTGAAEKWMQFYDQATADLVYELYKDDFLAFGYERLVLEE